MVGAYQEIPATCTTCFGDTEAADGFVLPDGSVEVELPDEGDTVVICCNMCTGSKNAVNAFPRLCKTDGSGRCVAAAVPFLRNLKRDCTVMFYLEDERCPVALTGPTNAGWIR